MEDDCNLEMNAGSLSDDHRQSKRTENSANAPSFLWKCFQVSGIYSHEPGTFDKCSLKMCCFPFIMHAALIVNTALLVTSIGTDKWNVKITLACASTNLLSIASWHSMNRNRNKLKTAIDIYGSMPELDTAVGNTAVKLVLAMFCTIPNVYSILCAVYFSSSPDPSFWLYGTSVQSMHPYGTALLFLNVNLYISLQVLFPGLCTCAYCFLCCAAHKWLKNCEMTLVSADADSPTKNLVTEYFKALATAELLQSAFSVPIFLIILMHVLHMFSLLATLLTYTKDEFSVPTVCEACVILFTSVFSTLAVVVCADRIPNQACKVKWRWKRFWEELVLEGKQPGDDIKLAAHREIITMTACDVVTLQKRFILSVFGALFTYGFLVMQINK